MKTKEEVRMEHIIRTSTFEEMHPFQVFLGAQFHGRFSNWKCAIATAEHVNISYRCRDARVTDGRQWYDAWGNERANGISHG